VNPVVSVELFRAPEANDPEFKTLTKRRARLLATATDLYNCLDANPPRENGEARPRTKITVKGQSATTENHAIFLKAAEDVKRLLGGAGATCGHRTMIQALDAAPENADTLVLDYFPSYSSKSSSSRALET
jgi:hypothetical protein